MGLAFHRLYMEISPRQCYMNYAIPSIQHGAECICYLGGTIAEQLIYTLEIVSTIYVPSSGKFSNEHAKIRRTHAGDLPHWYSY